MPDVGQNFLQWVLTQTTQVASEIPADPVFACFQALGWRVERLPQGVRWRYRGQHGSWWCLALLRGECFTCYSRYPQAARPEQLVPLGELIARMNYGLLLGNWELDWRDGDIRYKTSLDLQGMSLESRWLKRFLASHLGTFDHYWPAVNALLTQGVSPVVALEAVAQLPKERDLGHPKGKPL
ncbi:hypothetical protein GlitD10_2879 [Gloeomargarita lithophora Alchichica-D10]|uniref:YbjN domain-containing protein n=1 Tax=Gloeomargarita lithophora Alchichica-D10 TaxID=1188229 RepID=A0A1J0AH31_9CYAN|nr:YbjN domain-containing protein [Gloeomargarita lithophora]APB35223.1 hypothetical protein GlitD10_2879 [Gloeomargarita lithophora Alchichica-D10]